MRIAIVTFGYPNPKNSARYVFTKEQADALVAEGAEVIIVEVAADPKLYPTATREEFAGRTVYRLPAVALKFRPAALLARRAYLDQIMREANIDLTLLNFLRHEHLYYASIFRRHSRMLGMIVHGGDVMVAWLPPWMRVLKRALLRRMQIIFAVSDFTANLARAQLPAKHVGRVHLNLNGIAATKLAIADRLDKAAVRRKHGLGATVPVLLTTANLVPRKGIDVMLRTVASLRRAGVDATYLIVGEGAERGRLERLTRELGIAEHVRFLGRILDEAELIELHVASDLYCMISRTIYTPPAAEGFGVANAEAQAIGRPVIGGRSGGVASAVADGFTGVLVDPDAPDVVDNTARAIRELLADPERYAAMCAAARSWARSRFDWRRNARDILRTAQAALAAGATR